MKKLISLLLCALMIMSLSIAAFAAPAPDVGDESFAPAGTNKPGAEVQAHSHIWTADGTVNGDYTYRDEFFCAIPVYPQYKCSCGAKKPGDNPIDYKFPVPHNGAPYAASCNGTIQTWQCTCNRCGGRFITTRDCPAGPHTPGYCNVLPVSIDIKEVM